MQIGIGTYTYGWAVGIDGHFPPERLDECGLIDRALSLGIFLVQVGDNLPLHSFSADRLTRFKKLLEANQIRVEVGSRGLAANQLNTYIEIAHFLNAGLLRFVIDDGAYQPSMKDVERLIARVFPMLEKYNITLAIENHDRVKAKDLGAMIGSFYSDRVGICMDSVNSMGTGEGLETIIEYLAPHAVNLHIKDFGITRLSHKQGFSIEGRIAGQGMLDIPALIRTVRQYGKCHSCILEQWVPPAPTTVETLFREADWASQGINYLLGLTGGFKNYLTIK